MLLASHMAAPGRAIEMAARGQSRYAVFDPLLGGTVITGPGDEKAAVAGRGHRRVSHADREQIIGTLKAAFVQGRLTKDEFDARIDQTLTARRSAELVAITADIPAELAGGQPPRELPRWRMSNAVRWGASGFITPAILAAAFGFASLPGGGGYGAAGVVIAFVYFMFWLSAGANMLWEWHCTSLPAARVCVRCAHTAASHRAPASCRVRLGSLKVWRCCPCAGYVPPGLSPETVDVGLLPNGYLYNRDELVDIRL
jgi:Domain of unknown function (DUF1707)